MFGKHLKEKETPIEEEKYTDSLHNTYILASTTNTTQQNPKNRRTKMSDQSSSNNDDENLRGFAGKYGLGTSMSKL